MKTFLNCLVRAVGDAPCRRMVWLLAPLLTFTAIAPVRAAEPEAPPPVVTLSAEITLTVSSENLAEATRNPASPADLATKLKTIATVFDNPSLVIRTDYKTSHLRITEILRACETAGLTHVRVETGGPVASIR